MNRVLATGISIVFHPVFVNLICLFALFSLFPGLHHGLPVKLRYFYILFIFVSTSILPLIVVLLLRLTGSIQSLTMEESYERHLPYLVTTILYAFNFYNLNTTPGTPNLILLYLLACTIILGLVFVINFFSKISIHLVTLGACAGLVVSAGTAGFEEVRWILGALLLVSGITAVARLSLNAHVSYQLYSGFGLGFLIMYFLLNLKLTFA